MQAQGVVNPQEQVNTQNTYQVPQPQHVCPACGYCPCCGRQTLQPYNPWQPVWINPWPTTITCGGTTSNMQINSTPNVMTWN